MIFHGRARYVVLAAMSLLYFLLMAGTFNSLGIVLPAMVRDLGMDWAQAGFGFTLLGTACGIASLAPALLIRRLGVSLTLVVGTAILLAGFVCFATTHSVLSYHLGAVLLGLGFCFCGTVPGVHVLSSIFEQRRSTALGVYFTVGSLGAVAGPLFYMAAQAITTDWRRYWLMFGIGAVIVGGLTALITRGRTQSQGPITDAPEAPFSGPDWAVRAAFGTVQFWVIVFAYTACLLVNTTMHSFAYQHLNENGLGAAGATELISFSALIGAAGAALAGVIGEKIAPRTLTMLSLGSLAIAALTLGVGHGGLVLGLFAVSMGVGLGFSYVSTAMLMQEYFGRRASLELYSIMTAVSTSAALGPGLGGIVRDRTGSFSGVFYALAAIDLALLLVVAAMRRPAPHAAVHGGDVAHVMGDVPQALDALAPGGPLG
jgi:MFS family permease